MRLGDGPIAENALMTKMLRDALVWHPEQRHYRRRVGSVWLLTVVGAWKALWRSRKPHRG